MSNKKSEVLAMAVGTAGWKLRKIILFDLLKRHNENVCFRCNEPIDNIDELSIDHKVDWLNAPNAKELFWDINNIAFSHLRCNAGAGGGGKISAELRRKSPRERKQYQRDYRQSDKYRSYRRKYEKDRYASDPNYRQYYLDKNKTTRA